MKKLGLALALVILGTAGASAQGIQLRIGDDDRYDRRERVIVRERDRDWDDRRRVREVVSTGSTCIWTARSNAASLR